MHLLKLAEDLYLLYLVQTAKPSKNVRQPGIEPGSIAWKATMLTFTPPTLDDGVSILIETYFRIY